MKNFSMRPICAEIDIAALRHNTKLAKQQTPNAALMAVVKANAYGHGAPEIAAALKDIVDEFGVASIDDAIQLREMGIELPITALSNYWSKTTLEYASRYKVDVVAYDEAHLALLSECATPINVWFKFDTGMGRLGFSTSCAREVLKVAHSAKAIHLRGVMSHFANADLPNHVKNANQLASFESLLVLLKNDLAPTALMSMANSAATLEIPGAAYDLVRPGIMLYGASPLINKSAVELNLTPVMTLRSRLISVKQLKQGDAVGYGGAWKAPESMLVGVVACGYGDGYPRGIPENTHVLVNGVRAPIVGRVSMDLMSVDLRGLENVEVGAEVILWGADLPVEELANKVGTIAYELLCGVTSRVSRRYISENTHVTNITLD